VGEGEVGMPSPQQHYNFLRLKRVSLCYVRVLVLPLFRMPQTHGQLMRKRRRKRKKMRRNQRRLPLYPRRLREQTTSSTALQCLRDNRRPKVVLRRIALRECIHECQRSFCPPPARRAPQNRRHKRGCQKSIAWPACDGWVRSASPASSTNTERSSA
jgi:hypothetical protein